MRIWVDMVIFKGGEGFGGFLFRLFLYEGE